MILAIAISWFTVGLMVWYSFAFAGSTGWHYYYYLWDKANYVFLFGGLWLNDNKQFKNIYKWMAGFAAIRLLWEIISLTTGWNVNNTRSVVGLFLLLTATILGILIKELLKWRRQKLRH